MEDDHHIGKNEEEKTELFPNTKKPRNNKAITSLQNLGNQNQWQEHMVIMDDSSNSNGSSSSSVTTSSPIARIVQDHLFSILLLLPVESILCFAMTCKRIQNLTYSDTLWEAICRRDWGHSSIDAFKSSQQQQKQLSWKSLYQQVHQMDTVYCHRILSDPDGDEVLPTPRASHSLNFVSGCLVIFGGGCDGGRDLDDTWVAYIGNDFRRLLKWQKITTGIPSGRFGHSCVVIGDSLVLFGGINDHGIRKNDTWITQIATHERFGITLSWRLLDVGPFAPPPRGAHAASCIDNKRMLIHGGIGLSGRLGDTWILELSENMSFGSWQEIVTCPSPQSRSGHTLTHIGGNRTILFGGRGLGYQVLNDVWVLDAGEGHWTWGQLLFELQSIPHGLSLARVGHSASLILGSRLLIYGGEDSHRHRKDDFWVLDISSIASATTQPITTMKQKELCTKMWRRLKTKGDKPSCRSFHRACVDHSGCYLYMFGGMVDGLLEPAESLGLRFDGELFLVELQLQC